MSWILPSTRGSSGSCRNESGPGSRLTRSDGSIWYGYNTWIVSYWNRESICQTDWTIRILEFPGQSLQPTRNIADAKKISTWRKGMWGSPAAMLFHSFFENLGWLKVETVHSSSENGQIQPWQSVGSSFVQTRYQALPTNHRMCFGWTYPQAYWYSSSCCAIPSSWWLKFFKSVSHWVISGWKKQT